MPCALSLSGFAVARSGFLDPVCLAARVEPWCTAAANIRARSHSTFSSHEFVAIARITYNGPGCGSVLHFARLCVVTQAQCRSLLPRSRSGTAALDGLRPGRARRSPAFCFVGSPKTGFRPPGSFAVAHRPPVRFPPTKHFDSPPSLLGAAPLASGCPDRERGERRIENVPQ